MNFTPEFYKLPSSERKQILDAHISDNEVRIRISDNEAQIKRDDLISQLQDCEPYKLKQLLSFGVWIYYYLLINAVDNFFLILNETIAIIPL